MLSCHQVLRVSRDSLAAAPWAEDDPCHIEAVLGGIIQPLLQACRSIYDRYMFLFPVKVGEMLFSPPILMGTEVVTQNLFPFQ